MYNKPCFIVGLPRSGTTLLQGILCNTGYYFPLPETHYFSKIATDIPEINISASQKKKLKKRLQRKTKIHIKQSELNNLNTKKEIFEGIINLYNYDNFNTFLEKTPRHVFNYKEISKYYPDARFICMIREPRNTVSSILNMSEQSQKKSITRMALLYNEIVSNINAIRNNKNVKVVRYEDLVDDPHETIKGICDFLKIAFNPKYLKNISAPKNMIYSHEKWKKNNIESNKIKKNDSFKWKSSLNDEYGNLIIYLTKNNLKTFNYDFSFSWYMLLKGIVKDFFNNLNRKEMLKIVSKKF
jgi:hypothetical protein